MSEVMQEKIFEIAGGPCRILEKGSGPRVGVMAGHNGMPRWTPFLEALAREKRVVLISPPGFPGSGAQFETFDNHIDWMMATIDLLHAADLAGCDLLASSVAGILAADVATIAPDLVKSLTLAAPYGLFDVALPVKDFFAHTPDEAIALLCADREKYDEAFGDPDDDSAIVDWRMTSYRTSSAVARLVWPFGDKGLSKRLHRVRCSTLLMWGAGDQVVPPAYADRFAALISAPTRQIVIPGANHLVWIDRPGESAAAILTFLNAKAPVAEGRKRVRGAV